MEENFIPQENPPVMTIKNPWWIKAMPHFFIICTFINVIAKRSINIFDILVIAMWMFYGTKINRNQMKADGFIKFFFIAFVIIDCTRLYPEILQIIAFAKQGQFHSDITKVIEGIKNLF